MSLLNSLLSRKTLSFCEVNAYTKVVQIYVWFTNRRRFCGDYSIDLSVKIPDSLWHFASAFLP